jgi:hypothetical protein
MKNSAVQSHQLCLPKFPTSRSNDCSPLFFRSLPSILATSTTTSHRLCLLVHAPAHHVCSSLPRDELPACVFPSFFFISACFRRACLYTSSLQRLLRSSEALRYHQPSLVSSQVSPLHRSNDCSALQAYSTPSVVRATININHLLSLVAASKYLSLSTGLHLCKIQASEYKRYLSCVSLQWYISNKTVF